ncbi:MAG TPA: tetratricopeptide repeat protein [Elusimicrobiota bacterium]|nr:tetratricopeptide repeat protein [Elusimicrobiota bacterium]
MPNKFILRWGAPTVVAFVTAVVFFPVLKNGFVNWDDAANFLQNLSYRGLGWPQLRWMWTTFHMGHYIPLSWMTLGLDYLLWGMNPFGYHLTNLLLHAANATVFYFLATRLLRLGFRGDSSEGAGDISWAAVFAALLFSVHPLRVESVAWITERRDVLSGFFYLLSIYYHVRAFEENETGGVSPHRRWSLFFYGLALLSKSVAVTLPLTLVLLDIYPLRRLGGADGWGWSPLARRVWQEKGPYVLLALPIAYVTVLAHRDIKAPLEYFGLLFRAGLVFYQMVFYLAKTVWPSGLSPLYELPLNLESPPGGYFLCAGGVVAVSVSLLVFFRRLPAVGVAWWHYVLALLPMTNFLLIAPYRAADRYTYLPCLSWALLAGAGLVWWSRRSKPGRGALLFWGAAGLVLFFGVRTWGQIPVWRDSNSLWTHVLRVEKKSAVAYDVLGRMFLDEGDPVRAAGFFQKALELRPGFGFANANMARILQEAGRPHDASAYYQRALASLPNDFTLLNGYATCLMELNRSAEAKEFLGRAIAVRPTAAEPHYNLGMLLAGEGRDVEALAAWRTALDLDPADVDVRVQIGLLLSRKGDLIGAVSHYRAALDLNPASLEAHYNLGMLLKQGADWRTAFPHFRKALEINPRLPQVWLELGDLYRKSGEIDEAANAYRQALALNERFQAAAVALRSLQKKAGRASSRGAHDGR